MLHCPTCGRHYADDLKECPEDGTPLQADATVATERGQDSLIGLTLDDKYRLDERLGEGGMGTVYRGTHLLIDRPVAVKVLNTRFVEDGAAQERFRREARAAGRLRHTNAVAVTDFGRTADGVFYIVMELLEGRSLRDVLAREAPLDTARAVALMLQISAAVAAAHEEGVIHRDLKPGNIFVVQRPHAPTIIKVLDFGIAKLASEAGDGHDQKPLTQTGVMIGTPRYMSPEQCDGAELTPASDVYSLGIILYEMLTGTTPFTGPTPLSVALKHSSELPRAPREFVSTIPAELEKLVLHALEKKPEERPPDAGAFRRELYATAQQLGLEHAEGFSAPTLDSLRDAGTETPSGRLVIDIERLRESRAARPKTTEAQAHNTAEEKVVETGGARDVEKHAFQDASVADASAHDASAHEAASVAPERSEQVVARVEVPLTRKAAFQQRLRQPLVLIAIAVAVFSLALILVALFMKATRAPVSANNNADDAEATGRYITPGANEPKRSLPAREPASAAEFYERGGYYFSTRDYDNAIKDFRRALELQKDFPTAHNRLGRALMAKGQLAEAADQFRAAIEQQGGNFYAAQYNLAFALQQQGDNENAIKAYDAAISQRGGIYPDAFYQKGIALLSLKRDGEAADAFRKSLDQNNNRDADAELALGAALARQKDFQGAETAFRAAIEQRAGNFPEAHYNLGYLYENTNRPADAVKEYETYLQQNPGASRRQDVENSLKKLRSQTGSGEAK
ncbi:MAG TPA: serine/threonine-protein kinase [Pyrinomonadaceae bacterium]|jgi:serine/threonine-protein kinase